MKTIRWLVRLSLGLVLSLALAGCGATATAQTTDSATPSATAPQHTATPAPPPLATADAGQLAACGMTGATGVTRLGDLLVTRQDFFGAQTRKVPDGAPLAPFHVVLPAGAGMSQVSLPAADPEVNPSLGPGLASGYEFSVCNSSSSQAHMLNGVGVRIEGAARYSGQLNAWNPCDGPYDASTKQVGGGCGGGVCGYNETLKATFNMMAAGATATVAQVGSDRDLDPGAGCLRDSYGPLPVSLKPHKAISIDVGIALPSSDGTYTFAFGVAQDSSATVFLPAARPILLAPIAHQWTGEACQQPAMQSQIPPASSPTYYICPVL